MPQRPKTLRLTRPNLKTPALILLTLVVLALGLELLARTEFVAARLIAPGIGIANRTVDGKLRLLDQLVAERGSVDCVILGSSMVVWAIDPEIVAEAYHQQTGQEIVCFNFGVSGFTASESATWAEVIARRYQPRLLVLGHSARDYSPRSGGAVFGFSVDVPWVRYQLGQFAPEGWLIEHSRAYQYYMTYSFWPVSDYHDRVMRKRRYEERLSPYGFIAATGTVDVTIPPDMDVEVNAIMADEVAAYEMSDFDVQGLGRFLRLRGDGPDVLLLEMPVPATYHFLFDRGWEDYNLFVETTAGMAESEGVAMIRSGPLDLIPGDCCWSDYAHLNQQGAAIFSAWLGEQLADAVQTGAIHAPPSDRT